jgi:signal transduction histidine kinase
MPMLIAVRQVQTPDGELAQGLVLSKPNTRLWSMAGLTHLTSQVVPRENSAAEFAPGWAVEVQPTAEELAQADANATAEGRRFLMRFFGVSSVALLAAAAVMLLVRRSESLARERSQFAAAAAHELRTPLAGLQLYGDMLADGLGDPAKTREYARHISEDAARLGRVVANMLGFSELERGGMKADATLGPLGQVLHELARHTQPTMARSGAELHLDVPIDLVAHFDRDALARIVGNLLENAEKYTRGSSDRSIRLAAVDTGAAVEVIVEDHGPGVANVAMLFRPFTRGSNAASGGPAGLGLGLALSRSLARAMGGDLAYRPSPAGATFVLRLRSAQRT